MNTVDTAKSQKKRQHTFATALVLLALFSSPAAMAYDPSNPLGLSAGLNLLAFDNFSVPSSDVEGRVAIGGNANISGYSINTKNGYNALYSGTGLTVGGNLNFISGNILGDTIVGGNLLSSSTGSFGGNLKVIGDLNAGNQWLVANSITYGGKATGLSNYQEGTAIKAAPGSMVLGMDFAAERARTTDLSQTFDELANTGSVLNSWGTLSLNANGASLAVFDLSSADLAGNLNLEGLTTNTTVVINVHGQSVDFGAHSYGNFASGRVLFNLPEAKQITFGAYLNASFLAPLASFSTSGGTINGQVIVANWSGAAQINDVAFRGNIAAVPEPETYALMLAGLVAVFFAAKRRSKSQAETA
jgi:choice-of-anchor A domain-containing protein